MGDGEDRIFYENYCKKLNIQNIYFEGRKNPLPYYQKASIFMMTSKNEGWPLTLLEALQFGVVPVVMDSFAALHDIINDGVNGYIVEYNNEYIFKEKVISLMENKLLYQEIAKEGQKSCMRFSIENIGELWLQLMK